MPYTLSQELSAYCEILAIAEDEINHLLFCDHPPYDYLKQIQEKNSIIEDLNWLIQDINAQIALGDLKKNCL
tara:strand:+ start:1465 stop:1680 length:216 start_codon:yes stop_codon:yes gene_type:complete